MGNLPATHLVRERIETLGSEIMERVDEAEERAWDLSDQLRDIRTQLGRLFLMKDHLADRQ